MDQWGAGAEPGVRDTARRRRVQGGGTAHCRALEVTQEVVFILYGKLRECLQQGNDLIEIYFKEVMLDFISEMHCKRVGVNVGRLVRSFCRRNPGKRPG